jgi:hypothetical protein
MPSDLITTAQADLADLSAIANPLRGVTRTQGQDQVKIVGVCRTYREAVLGPARIRYAKALRAGLSPGF